MKTRILTLLIIFVIVTSCSKDNDEVGTEGSTVVTEEGITIRSLVSKAIAEGMTNINVADEEDLLENSTFSSTVKITFGNTIEIDNPLEGKGVKISESNGDVIISSTVSELEYELSGSTANGSVKIYSEKKFKLTLNNVSIMNDDGPAINIQSGKRAFVVLADQSNNTLEDGVTYSNSTDEDQKGTFFSEGQLIFSGGGTLNVVGNNKHGIVTDDYIRFISGTINVVKAASDGLHSNDGIFIDGGTFDITAASDGIEAEKGQVVINSGDFNINVVDDGITAYYTDDNSIDPYVVINDGTFKIKTSEGEGIESKSTLTINGGQIYIDAYDDAINAGKAIYINDGTIVAFSSSNDAIDSNGILTISGGKTFAIGRETGFDCDNNTFKITGGLLIGGGGSTSMPTSNVSTQASVILGNGNANNIYSLLDNENKELITFKSPSSFSTLVLSTGGMAISSSYKLVNVSDVENTTEFKGLYTAGTFSNPIVASTFTLSAMVTRIGGSTGPGGGR